MEELAERSGRPRCYVASPAGFTEAGRYWYAEILLPMLARHVEVVDPWALTSAEEAASASAAGRQSDFWIEVADRNYTEIEASDMLVAVLDGEPPDNGTVAEVAWAARSGLLVLGYRSDLRQSGEGGVPVNLMIPEAIHRSGGHWANTLSDLEVAVVETVKAIVHRGDSR